MLDDAHRLLALVGVGPERTAIVHPARDDQYTGLVLARCRRIPVDLDPGSDWRGNLAQARERLQCLILRSEPTAILVLLHPSPRPDRYPRMLRPFRLTLDDDGWYPEERLAYDACAWSPRGTFVIAPVHSDLLDDPHRHEQRANLRALGHLRTVDPAESPAADARNRRPAPVLFWTDHRFLVIEVGRFVARSTGTETGPG